MTGFKHPELILYPRSLRKFTCKKFISRLCRDEVRTMLTGSLETQQFGPGEPGLGGRVNFGSA